ncbi:hypothetical protein PPERSA_10859 [Pseudocohnilembus persalinus]|uniref:Uncharacterized protein n=1 Tax=Pseudocohnilembus persalinus TaxID=266149 RepID=A0A0V0QDV0_PSEPJ|nr:hypothetical protein PPERSA_10859 [Pseudocohnilembus persalinus]|eukprot:KRX00360.1 hypothetical protein PPERSA_10859 [Pseudocohnilembus persalinus]
MEQTILGLYPNSTKRELIAKNYKGDIKQFNRFINDQQTNIDFKKVMEIYDVKEINFTQDEKNKQNDEYFIKYTFTRGKQQLIKFLSHELQETQNQNQQNNMEIEQIPQINKISPQQDQTISSNNISPEKTQTDETKYTETINETQQSFNSEEHTAESQENKILQKRQAILDLITIYIFDYVQNPQISHDQKHYHGVKLMALLETYLKIFKQELNPNSYQNQPINKSEQILDKSIQLNCEINSQECLYQKEIKQEQNQKYCQSQIISDSLKNKNQINQEQQNSILQLLYGYGQDKEIQGEVTNSRQIQNYIKQTQIEQLEQRFNKIKEQIKLLPIQETNQLPQQQQYQQQQQTTKQLNIFLNAESYNDCQNWIAINYQFKKIMNISGRVLGLKFSDNQQDNQKNYNNTIFDKNGSQYPEETKDENQENSQKQEQKANKAFKNLDQKGIKLINKSKTIKKDKKNENKININNKKTKQYDKQKKLSDNSQKLDSLQNNLLFQQEEEVYQEDLDPILQKQIDL